MPDIEKKPEQRPEWKESQKAPSTNERLTELKKEMKGDISEKLWELKVKIIEEKEKEEADELEKKIPENKEKKDVNIPKQDIQRKEGQERSKTHPGENNRQRAVAGSEIQKELATPQKNPIAQGLQGIINRLIK